MTLDGVTSHLTAQGLARHKLPERLEVLAALPRGTALRKVLKQELRERFAGDGRGRPRGRPPVADFPPQPGR